jgi:hypothetical protein
MKILCKVCLFAAVALMLGQAVPAAAYRRHSVVVAAPCYGYGVVAAPAAAFPVAYGYPAYGYAYAYAAPATVVYAPSVAVAAYPYPYAIAYYPAPVVMPRVVAAPTYMIIR